MVLSPQYFGLSAECGLTTCNPHLEMTHVDCGAHCKMVVPGAIVCPNSGSETSVYGKIAEYGLILTLGINMGPDIVIAKNGSLYFRPYWDIGSSQLDF